MVKHRKRRSRSRGFVAIPFADDFVLGALANNAVILEPALQAAFDNTFYCISADLQLTVAGLTAGEGDPSTVGWAHGDYTAPEVAEALNVTLLGPASKIEQERSRRLVRRTGVCQTLTGLNDSTQLNMIGGGSGGRIVRTKINFVIQEDVALNIWFMNRSDATIQTGATCRFSGTMYGRWIL